MNRPPVRPAQAPAAHGANPPGTGTLGMWFFLLSLAVLFAASLVAFIVVRGRAEQWPPPGMPRLPSGLWLSTLLLLAASGTVQWALAAARAGRQTALRAALASTLALGVLFLVSQTANWMGLVRAQMAMTANLYAFTFYMLTGLHAAHVVGGLVLLAVVNVRAIRGRYGPGYHPGVLYSAMYWHFLDGVWLVMFALLVLLA